MEGSLAGTHGQVSHMMSAMYVTRLFEWQRALSLGGGVRLSFVTYTGREKEWFYQHMRGPEDKANFTGNAWFLLVLLLLGHPRSNQRCVVAETVLPSPTTGSHTQEGCFMLIEWSDWFCGTFTAGIFELLLQMKVCRVDSFSGVCVLDVTIYND